MALGLDLGQPHLGVLLGRLGAPPLGAEDAAMRAGADAGVFAIAPVDEIVPAFGAGAGLRGLRDYGDYGGITGT